MTPLPRLSFKLEKLHYATPSGRSIEYILRYDAICSAYLLLAQSHILHRANEGLNKPNALCTQRVALKKEVPEFWKNWLEFSNVASTPF